MKRLLSILAAFCFLGPLHPVQGADVRFGVSLGEIHNDPNHFGVAKGWQDVASMGAGYARFDIPWSSMEWRPAGNYILNSEKAGWISLAHAQGLKVCVIVLAGGSGVYSPPADVYPNPFDPSGYSKACAWLAANYLQAGDVIEVLNEPNNGYPGFNGATATTAAEQNLVAFTTATTQAVHAAAPTIKVIGLGAQGKEILDMLAMSPVIDGVVYHPYSNGSNNWPETTYEPPYLDYEQWLAALKSALPAGAEIWETEFAENNGSDAYTRSVWLTRRWLMSAHAGIVHWFPHGLVFNGINQQQFEEWNGLNPRMSYYSVSRLFVPGGLFEGATPSATLPTITGSDSTKTAKGYVFNGNGTTLCGIWYAGNNISGYSSGNLVSVSFPTTLTNVGGSYILDMVSGDAVPIKATVSSGMATVTGATIATNPSLIVLAPGGTPPITFSTAWVNSFNAYMGSLGISSAWKWDIIGWVEKNPPQ